MSRRAVVPFALTALAVGLAAALPAEAAAKAPTFRRTVLADQRAYGEPSLAVTKDGKHIAVCVPGGTGTTSVWYSGDDGHTFATSHTNSDNGGGDCELEFMPNGLLLNADLEVTDSAIRYSKDFGKTWQGTATAGVEQDRQWFAHSKDGKKAYLVYHDFVAEAEFYAESPDGGLTWPVDLAAQPVTNVDQIALPGNGAGHAGDPASIIDQGVNTFSGPMLISPDGQDTYVLYSISDAKSNVVDGIPPFGPTRGVVVAHRGPEDGGFNNKYAIVSDGTTTNGAIFPWGTIDKAGNVYVLFNSDKGSPGHFHTYYTVSKNKGSTWQAPVKVDDTPLTKGAQIYVTGAAGDAGVLDLAWYGSSTASSPGDDTATWDIKFAQVRNALSAHPTITRANVAPGDAIHKGNICLNGLLCIVGGDRSLADFIELAIGPDGMAQIAYADNAGTFTGTRGRVTWAKQVTGGSAYGGTTVTAPPVKTPTKTSTGGTKTGSGNGLAATGLGTVLPGAALLLLLVAAVVRRNRLTGRVNQL